MHPCMLFSTVYNCFQLVFRRLCLPEKQIQTGPKESPFFPFSQLVWQFYKVLQCWLRGAHNALLWTTVNNKQKRINVHFSFCEHGSEALHQINHTYDEFAQILYKHNNTLIFFLPTGKEKDRSHLHRRVTTNGSRFTFMHKIVIVEYKHICRWQVEQWSRSLATYRSPLYNMQVVWLFRDLQVVCHTRSSHVKSLWLEDLWPNLIQWPSKKTNTLCSLILT